MAVSYNVIERGEPGVSGGGESKFYASAKMTGEVDEIHRQHFFLQPGVATRVE